MQHKLLCCGIIHLCMTLTGPIMIEFKHVFKSYGRSPNILVDLNFRIDAGEFIFISGPSGAGKSTLLRLIGGLEAPSRGAVLVQGNRVDQLPARGLPYLRRSIGLILQDIHLLNDRSALHNVMLPLEVLGIAPQTANKRARAALEKVGLGDKCDHYPVELSGGGNSGWRLHGQLLTELVGLLQTSPLLI